MTEDPKDYLNQVLGYDTFTADDFDKEDLSGLTKKQQLFITTYIANGGITRAALKAAGATRTELVGWRKDEKFSEALKAAEENWMEELRKAAILRAQSKSDILLIFLLKAFNPEVFDDNVRNSQIIGSQAPVANIPVRATLIRDNNIQVIQQIGAQAPEVLPPPERQEPQEAQEALEEVSFSTLDLQHQFDIITPVKRRP